MNDWACTLPYALHAFRALAVLGLAAVPRTHPWRELLLTQWVLLALASDLADGAIARALRMTHLESLYWSDHGADLVFFFGAVAVIGGKLSLAHDRAAAPLSRDERKARWKAERWGAALRIAVTVALAAAVAGMIFLRAFRAY